MPELKQNKKIITNTAYTMGGMLLLNGVLQIIVYPLLNRNMGAEQMGAVLYLMGLVSILCPSVGQALNTSRLVVRRTHKVKNGDYNLTILALGIPGSVVALLIAGRALPGMGLGMQAVIFVLLMVTVFRYYGDVEYRINLNYQDYFIYYLLISVGYLAGFGVYKISSGWFFVFLIGEAAGLAYLAVKGTVFREFFGTSDSFAVVFQRGFFLTLSYLVTNLTQNIDRLMLKGLIGNVAVTEYYVVSLIGKTLVLLIAPVNTIVISYLTKREENLDCRQFLGLTGIGLVISGVFFGACQIVTPIFIRIFYPDLYEGVRGLVMVVSLSQILSLLSAFLFILVLTFTDEKWQLGLQIGHLCVMVVMVLMLTPQCGILGFSWAVLGANGMRILAVIVLGGVKAGGKWGKADG